MVLARSRTSDNKLTIRRIQMKKILFLYNPRSGRGLIGALASKICDTLARGGAEVIAGKIDFTTNPFDTNGDVDTVVVAGGDGTVNFIVNCMKSRSLDLVMGIIPAGTANDFAHALGMSAKPLKAAAQIAEGHVRRVDCGCVNGQYFVNVFSFGLFTTTSQHTPDLRKHLMGRSAYLTEGWKELRRMHGIPLHIRTEYEELDITSLMTLVFTGRTAGGFRLARMSSVRDGLLDCLILERRTFAASCWAMIRYLLGGNPRLVRLIRASHIEMTSPLNERTDADGQRGAEFPLSIDCMAGSLRVITGKKDIRENRY